MSRKSIQVVLMVVCFIFSVSSMAAAASIVGSKHDFSALSPLVGSSPFAGNFEAPSGNPITETCVFCHTPHSAAQPAGVTGLLWNRTNPSATSYTLYNSSTFSITTQPTGLTLMCMSCHDGITSIAVGTLINAPSPATNPAQVVKVASSYDKIGDIYFPNAFFPNAWGPNIGNLTPPGTYGTVANLSNDHPVSFAWTPGTPGFIDPVAGTWGATGLRLFGGRMECSTCHNVHDSAIAPFLRMSNVNSDMCTTCHIK